MKQEQKNLVDYIIDELKGVDVTFLKLDPDFLKYLAEIIENQVKSKKDKNLEAKPNKMDILVDIIKKLFPHRYRSSKKHSGISVEKYLSEKDQIE